LTNDPANCGNCGVVCAAGQTCKNGQCCTDCRGECCPPGAICVAGRDPSDPLDRACRLLSETICDNQRLTACLNQKDQDHATCLSECRPLDDPNCKEDCNRIAYYAGTRCMAQFGCLPGRGLCCPSGACAHLLNDTDNCGACGNACPPGYSCCSGVCKDLRNDVANCGTCGNGCPPGRICANGACVCPTGLTDCGGVCTDLSNDSQNCGACGNGCPPGRICANGACVCPTGLTDCGGVCTDLSNDSQNCGACGNQCRGGKKCQSGTCVCPSNVPDVCSDTCTNIKTDPNNCGACGTVCPSGQRCCAGVCKDLSSDASNCGACGTLCTGTTCSGKPNSCVNGQCTARVFDLVVERQDNKCIIKEWAVLANSMSEATTCVEQQYPAGSVVVGPPAGPFQFSVYCRDGFGKCLSCRHDTYWGLSASDAESCARSLNPDCDVVVGQCNKACPPNETDCCNTCVNLSTDSKNCGGCDEVCAAGRVCCGGHCVDTQSDSNNCGECGKECTTNVATCQRGNCECFNGWTACGDECMPTGNTCCQTYNCPSGSVCCGGGCCPAGTTCCNGGCCPAGTTCGADGLCH
jgi:hypothetical protein